ncbi:hypothetical protein, partial [Anoxynatronum buryatiense]
KNKNLTKKVAARLTFKGSYGFNFSVLLSNSRVVQKRCFLAGPSKTPELESVSGALFFYVKEDL